MSVNFTWVKCTAGRGRGNAVTEDITIGKVKAGFDTEGTQKYHYGLILPITAMKMARFVIGDKVEVGFGFDPEKGNCVAVRRVIDGGYMISISGGNTKDQKGRTFRGRIQLKDDSSVFEEFNSITGGYDVDDRGMLIAWDGKQ